MDTNAQTLPAKPDGDSRCPTCRAPWRGVTTCARCGSDLSMVMSVAARAWELREAARNALGGAAEAHKALELALAAYRLHATPRGQRLLVLTLLAAGRLTEAAVLLQQGQELQ